MSKIQYTPLNNANYVLARMKLDELTTMINKQAVACGQEKCNKAGVCTPNTAIWSQGAYEVKPKWDKLMAEGELGPLVR